MEPIPQSARWSSIQKLAFRLVAAYFIIYIVSNVLDMVGLGIVPESFAVWVGKSILHMRNNIKAVDNGSGDTSYQYVAHIIMIALAVVAGIVWTIADSKRPGYNKMLYWVTATVRYYLAFYLLVYGYSKFNNGQFPQPGFYRLMETYGESSPMGLAWTFLGYSAAFGVFMGFFESIGGILMLFRRTTLLGACIAATVTTNIVAINFCYDVPVKLFSAHLLLMCFFIIVLEGKRVLDFFIFNKPVPPADHSPIYKGRAWMIMRGIVKGLFIVVPIAIIMYELAEYGEDPKSPLYGIYTVQDFVRNNDTIPPLTTDSTRWDKLLLEYDGEATVVTMTKQKKYAAFKIDTVHKTVTMYTYMDSTKKYKLSYTKADSTLTLQGVFNTDTLYVKMRQYDQKKFLLTSRKFRWINERPFNR